MSVSNLVKKTNSVGRLMFSADVLFIMAFLFLTKTMSFQTIEYIILALVLISLVAIIAGSVSNAFQKYTVIVDVVNLVIAGFIAVRYGMAFVTDFEHFVALVLFLATVAFAAVFVLSVRNLISAMGKMQAVHTDRTKSQSINEPSISNQ